jgi:hypothetical protein
MNALSISVEENIDTIRQNMRSLMHSSLEIGRLLAEIRYETGKGFLAVVKERLGMSQAHAYRLISVHEKFGATPGVEGLSSTVLSLLAADADPQARLAEALALKAEDVKVTVEKAKELCKAAVAIIDSGEVESFEAVQPMAEPLCPQPEALIDQGTSLSREKTIKRAKRTLKTLVEVLTLETTNADLTDEDFKDAVLEMLLSTDEEESSGIEYLREFAKILCTPIF